jgi:hypothetical protein
MVKAGWMSSPITSRFIAGMVGWGNVEGMSPNLLSMVATGRLKI